MSNINHHNSKTTCGVITNQMGDEIEDLINLPNIRGLIFENLHIYLKPSFMGGLFQYHKQIPLELFREKIEIFRFNDENQTLVEEISLEKIPRVLTISEAISELIDEVSEIKREEESFLEKELKDLEELSEILLDEDI